MSHYGYPGTDLNSSVGSSAYSRDRFWSTPSSATTPEPWGSGPYTPQLELPSFSNQPPTDNQSYIPYGSQPNGLTPLGGSGGGGSSTSDLNFSGPSPPNPIQPIAISGSSSYPPPSPRRSHTSPSPHHIGSHSKSHHGQSPPVNGNGMNGSSNHSSGCSSNSGSPPNHTSGGNPNNRPPSSSFHSYMNGEVHHSHGSHPPPNGNTLSNGHHGSMQMKNGPSSGGSGMGDDVPGYLQPLSSRGGGGGPSSGGSGRYPGDIKSPEGDMGMMQQHQQQQLSYQHHQFYGNYGTYHHANPYYQDSPGGSYGRPAPPYDPYSPYGGGSGGNGGPSSLSSSSSPYPPSGGPPGGGGYHHQQHSGGGGGGDYTSSGSSSGGGGPTSSPSTDLSKDLLGNSGRKIDSSPTRDGKPGGNSHENHQTSFSSENDGRSNFESTLMNLNTSHGQQVQPHGGGQLGHHHQQQQQINPQDSASSCSSQSPSGFDQHHQHFPQSDHSHHLGHHHNSSGGLGGVYGGGGGNGSPPNAKRDDSINNNNEKLMKSPGETSGKGVGGDGGGTDGYGTVPEVTPHGKNSSSSYGSFKDPQQPPHERNHNRKLSNSCSPNSDSGGGLGLGPAALGDREEMNDIKPKVMQKDSSVPPPLSLPPPSTVSTPAKKKRKRNKPNAQNKNSNNNSSSNNEGGGSSREGTKDRNKSPPSVKVKEEPKDLHSSSSESYGKSSGLKSVKGSSSSEDSRSRFGGNKGDDLLRDDEDKGCGDGGSRGSMDDDSDDKKDVPMVECGCFPADEVHAEPGPFYTHLGAAHNLVEMRELIETRTGFRGNQVRFEKVIYTGKEGKTGHGCPLAKWILRRGSFEEQLLFLVKHRKGHKCATAWIVVCCVIWEGVPPHFADNLYDTLVYKLNRFGIPTTRRSDTNEQRSCACQGVDPDTCGAAYSFGCAWSMFFNGCKYARSRNVRKFRLTEEHEESELEEKVQHLATHLAPLYERVATESYANQIDHENEGLECRLGYRPGRPFSGVTACLDYCSHAHKDAHNMMNGCTVTVSLTRNRALSKGDDEQYHVLPLYKLDDTDEHGSKEGQKAKIKKGQLEILKKYPCKVRIRKVPLLPSRRRAKAKQSSTSSSKSEPGGGAAGPGGLGSTSLPSPANSSLSSLKSPSEYGSSSEMPPPKREKIFDDRLVNGGSSASGDGYGESRFHPAYPGLGSNGSLSSSSFGSDAPTGPIWNQFGSSGNGNPSTMGRSPSGGPGGSSSGTSAFGNSFESQQFSSSSSGPSTPFGHSGSLPNGGSVGGTGGSSSLNSLTELTNSTSMSRHGSNSNLTSLGTPGGSSSSSNNNLLSSPGSSGGNPGSASSGYSSMSPILPSFRNTFMTEAESMSMLSSMSSPTPSQPDSTSSPSRSSSYAKSGGSQGASQPPPSSNSQHSLNHPPGPLPPHSSSASSSSGSSSSLLTMSGPAFSDPSGSYNSYPGQGYSSSSSSGPPPPPVYHPQPHNPCLPSHHIPSPGVGPYSSSSMLGTTGSYGMSSGFGHHHHPHHPSDPHHYGMNPLSSWNPAAAAAAGYSSNYAAAAAYGGYGSHHHQSMGGLGMGMNPSNFGHPMNQYSPYPNRIPQQQMPNSWSSQPLPTPFAPPNMNLNIHHHPPPPPPSCFVTPPKPKVIPEVNESFSDNEDCFKDPQMGGVAIALTHGSVILQCAKHEMHATTALKNPNRMYPSRICLIFYQHKSMNNRFHGWSEWEKKIEAKKLQEVKLINQGKMEASPRKMKQLIKEGYITDNQ